MNKSMLTKLLGYQPYQPTWQAMQQLTASRDGNDHDQIWLCEHPPVYTQGRHGKKEHLIDAKGIPVVTTDRGGQISYHGPGQLIVYFMFNLKRLTVGIKAFVAAIEQALVMHLQSLNISAYNRPQAPGIYTDQGKIASIGLRVKRGFTYHGLAINVTMDLAPFNGINPCGQPGLAMTQLADHLDWPRNTNQATEGFSQPGLAELGRQYIAYFQQQLSI